MALWEQVPQKWDDARDTAFVTLTARHFAPAFAAAATVLLASYDLDPPQERPSTADAAVRALQAGLLRCVPRTP